MLKLYFIEIRNRMFIIFLEWVVIFGTCYCYKETLLYLFIKPYIQIYPEIYSYFIATNLTEIFSSYMIIVCFIVNQFTTFFAVSQLLFFFLPALYKEEYKKVRNLILFSFLLWLLNILFLNNFMFPHVFHFFLSFQDSLDKQLQLVHFEIRLVEYLELYKNLFYFSACSFQIFLVIFIFINNLKYKKKFLKKYRKCFFFFFFFGYGY